MHIECNFTIESFALTVFLVLSNVMKVHKVHVIIRLMLEFEFVCHEMISGLDSIVVAVAI